MIHPTCNSINGRGGVAVVPALFLGSYFSNFNMISDFIRTIIEKNFMVFHTDSGFYRRCGHNQPPTQDTSRMHASILLGHGDYLYLLVIFSVENWNTCSFFQIQESVSWSPGI